MTYYLAIDIGASGGRHILGYVENGWLCTEEIYRFENGFVNRDGALSWDTEHLLREVKNGLKKCCEAQKIPKTVAIDTWGVDYVLLDEHLQELLPAYCYRDSRTATALPAVEQVVSPDWLYGKTGIQRQAYNTVYQLYADKLSGKLDRARYFLMMPAYLSYKLTGEMRHEYTLATTTGMVNAQTRQWDDDILAALGYPRELFGELSLPSSPVGHFTAEVRAQVGFDSTVVLAPSHDTAAAVAACPLCDGDAYISSGTWSLIGIESREALISDEIRRANFANEGGVEYRFRFLKNYMGMWLLQNIRKNIGKLLTYDEMMWLAQSQTRYRYFDVNDDRLVAPDNMVEAVRACCGDEPMTVSEVLASVYHSLAKSYQSAVAEIEALTGREITAIRIVGGGCQDRFLNELTAQYTGKPVTAGPVEATAIGNLTAQLLYDGVCDTLAKARRLIADSFAVV